MSAESTPASGGQLRGKRGPYAKTAERRTRIARAALDIVLEKGHSALTTAEVAHRADMGERAMLYHFPTRDHILVAAMELADDESKATFGPRPDGDLLELIADRLVHQRAQVPQRIRLFNAIAAAGQEPNTPANDYMRQHNARGIQGLAVLVRRRQAQGLAHPDIDPDTAARQMLAAWNGLQSQWLVDPSFDLADAVKQAFRRLTGQPTMEARALLDDVLARL